MHVIVSAPRVLACAYVGSGFVRGPTRKQCEYSVKAQAHLLRLLLLKIDGIWARRLRTVRT